MTDPRSIPEEGHSPAADRLVFGAHWGLLAFFIGIGGYHLLGMLAAVFIKGWSGGSLPLPEIGPLVLLAFLPTLALGAGPVVGSVVWGRGVRPDFGLVPNKRDFSVGIACGLFALLAGYTLSWLMMVLYGRDRLASPLDDLREGLGPNVVWLGVALLIIVVMAPLAEELLARGALWKAFEHYRFPPWAILVLTAAIFAYLHAEPVRTVALFAQGIAIGSARMITGRVGASFVAHATNNLPPAVLLILAGAS